MLSARSALPGVDGALRGLRGVYGACEPQGAGDAPLVYSVGTLPELRACNQAVAADDGWARGYLDDVLVFGEGASAFDAVVDYVVSLLRETSVRVDDLIYPMFVTEGEKIREPIDSMPGQYRFTVDELVAECQELWDLGIPAVNLFGYSTEKDDMATKAYDPEGLIQRAVRGIKAQVPELCVQTDIALDPYTNHGHDGLVVDDEIINDETVEVLCKMALSHAKAGVDWVAPSDMMDGRVGGIRQALDADGHTLSLIHI